MRSRALNRVFNRALIDLEYRRELLANLRSVLRQAEVPGDEIALMEGFSPKDIRELAQALEQLHVSSFQ